MAQYVYTMRRVSKTVPPKRTIIKNISLNFFPGAKIGVLGLNGSGKSTLLRIMAGEDKDFDGEAIPMPNLRIGFLPQEPRLDPTKNVRGNVEEGLGATLAAMKRLQEVYAAYSEPDADFEKLYVYQNSHAGYFPGAKMMAIKVLFRKSNGRLLGAQVLSEDGVAKRVDAFAMAIQMKATVYDLEEAELCYAPPFGSAKDPVNFAGMVPADVLRGDMPLCHWDSVGDGFLLDVRSPPELAVEHTNRGHQSAGIGLCSRHR